MNNFHVLIYIIAIPVAGIVLGSLINLLSTPSEKLDYYSDWDDWKDAND